MISERVTAGALLILSGTLFVIGASLPLVGEKGNLRIFTLPVQEQLEAIGHNQDAWRWANVFMGAAAIALATGLALLAALLGRAGGATLASLGSVTFLIAALLWVVFSAYRATVPLVVIEQMASDGAIPSYHQAGARWAGALFMVYAVLGFLSLGAYGGAIVQAGLLADWVGWATMIFSLGLLLLLLVMGDTLPAFHYMPALLIGIVLLMSEAS